VSALAFFGFVFGIQARPLLSQSAAAPLGIFEGSTDMGNVTPPGTTVYDPAARTYTLSAAGGDIWFRADDMHFVWKKVSGDISLTADIDFPVKTGVHDPHRKAVLMFRQSLDADSPYVDAAWHGSGIAALQYRRAKGSTTQDIEMTLPAPGRLRIEKRGDVLTLFLSVGNEPLHQVGASIRLPFDGPFYAGLGVCAHNTKAAEKAVFSNVELKTLTPPATPAQLALYSTLHTIGIDEKGGQSTMVYTTKGHFEAPNWTRDGKFLIFDQAGKIMKVAAAGGTPEAIDIGGYPLQRQPRPLARRQMVGHHLQHAGKAGVARLCCSARRRDAAPGDRAPLLVLAYLVARRQNDRLHSAEPRFRQYLRHPC